MLPDFRDYAVEVAAPGDEIERGDPRARRFLRDVIARNPRTSASSGPTRPRRTGSAACSTSTSRLGRRDDADGRRPSRADGRVMEMLSEHQCQGWLEGYLLTGRHGLFNCYEAFIHIVDSMFNQHAKWLKVTRDIPWRRPIASLNYLLSTHVWRQDHNGFSPPGSRLHRPRREQEGRGRSASTCRRMPTRCSRSPTTACASRNYVNVIVAGKQPALELPLDGRGDRALHPRPRDLGLGLERRGDEPDVVLGCCGDVPTLETLAAAAILREHLPELKVRVVNVVDLMRLRTRDRASARAVRRGVRHALHAGPAGRLRLPRLPVADPPADLPPGEPRTTSTSAATRRRARRRRRSTW